MPTDHSKLPDCIDCGAKLSAKHVKRCKPCSVKARVGSVGANRIPGLVRHPDDVRKIKRTCTICGADTWQSINYHKRATAFCGEKCRTEYLVAINNKRVEKTCLQCGKVFSIPACWEKRGSGRFCSMLCYRHYSGETRPEGNVRRCLDLLGIVFEQESRISRYRVDFLIPDGMIVLEVDAPYWHEPDAEKDQRRDDWMRSQGFRVIRVNADEYMIGDIEDMRERLANELHGVLPQLGVV
jgi:very-short-patch-repair endonuclease